MTYFEKIVDAATGETIMRPYTEEEVAEVKKAQKDAEKRIAAVKDYETKRQSALSKLIDLGLTEEEIAAL